MYFLLAGDREIWQKPRETNRAVFWMSCTDKPVRVRLGQRSLLHPLKPVRPASWLHFVSGLSTSPLKTLKYLKSRGKEKKNHIPFPKKTPKKRLSVVLVGIWSWFTSRLYFLQAPCCVSCGPSVNTEWRQQMYDDHTYWLKQTATQLRVIWQTGITPPPLFYLLLYLLLFILPAHIRHEHACIINHCCSSSEVRSSCDRNVCGRWVSVMC